jgi:hypothetical protein
VTKKDYTLLANTLVKSRSEAYLRSYGLDEGSKKVYDFAIDKFLDILLVELCNALKKVDGKFDEDEFYSTVLKE